MPVALKFKNSTQEKTVIVNNTFNGQQFIKQVGFVPDTVLVDPDYWIISKNNSTQKIALSNSGEGIADIYPNPVTDPLNIYLHDFSAAEATIQISNALGQVLYKNVVGLINGAELLQIPTRQWARGLYTVNIIAGNRKIVKQIVR